MDLLILQLSHRLPIGKTLKVYQRAFIRLVTERAQTPMQVAKQELQRILPKLFDLLTDVLFEINVVKRCMKFVQTAELSLPEK